VDAGRLRRHRVTSTPRTRRAGCAGRPSRPARARSWCSWGTTACRCSPARSSGSAATPARPAACIQDGTHPSQRVVVSTLEHLADDVAAAGLRAPVATVIGDVVRLRDALRWFDRDEET
jgi:hypothetical protein